MMTRSLNFFKLLITLIFLIVGIYLISQGNHTLQKIYIKNKNEINNINKNIKKINKIEINKSLNNTKLKESKKIINEKLIEKIIIVKKNDTFSKIIDPFFNSKTKNLIINKINKKYNLKNLNIGQKIYLYQNLQNYICKIIIPLNIAEDIVLDISPEKLSLKIEKVDITSEINSIEFIIYSSLYKDGIKAKVPLTILNDAIKLYSFDIDFQRDIQKNTKFEVSFETKYNFKRNQIAYGNIQFINLKIQNKDLEYFIFKTDDGFYDYYNKKGKNVKKTLLKTPIDGARLSSTFGMRKHPILGYNKLHKGVDFASPKGTPIFAGGNGVIEYAGINGGYGKYIRIRHNSEYKTAYAHLSSFKKGIYQGSRVNQGDIIGYVGSSGNSTGSHLHYEIIFNNKQINPMKMKLPSNKSLEGEELNKFNENIKKIYAKHLFVLYE